MLDFTKIRGDSEEGRRSFFEQLICRLGQIDGGGGEFRRIKGAGGDGGVEALRLLPTGKKVGYQAKYYLGKIDWGKIDDSVQTALIQHPELVRYIIAVPCDFTGRRAIRNGSTEGEWGTWDAHKAKWEKLARSNGLSVSFEPWTAFEIERAVTAPEALQLISFFFGDTRVFTREWMRQRLILSVAALQSRYSPSDHVDTASLRAFDLIYRRERVCDDLRRIFDLARSSNPRIAAALVPSAEVPEALLAELEASLQEFLDLGNAVDDASLEPWPVRQWLELWYLATRRLISLARRIDGGIPDDADASRLRDRVNEATKAYDLLGPEAFGGRWASLLPIDGSRAALFVGRAGAGKSHALARGADVAWNLGAPVVHVLGQHIIDDDPRASILKQLELTGWSFSDALAALDLAAETASTRALLVIDALNEGRGLDVWRNHLASFVRQVNAYHRITLVLSCREEYLPYVVPQELLAEPRPYPDQEGRPPQDCAPLGKLVRIPVDGFSSTQERELALRIFLDAKGIARPTAPVLDDEFFNPLFMSSVCRAMSKAGVKAFPRGLHGASEIFDFALRTKAKALGTRHDGTSAVYNALLRALDDLAGVMVARHIDHIPLREANGLVSTAFEALPIHDKAWLEVLEGSDILRRDCEPAEGPITPLSRPNEAIRFASQRLQDHLIARGLLNRCSDIERAFGPGGTLEFLLRRSVHKGNVPLLKPSQRWLGVMGALWCAVAELHEKELWDLAGFFGGPDVEFYRDDFQPVFQASVRERQGSAFTSRTWQILKFLWEEDEEEKLAILISTCCVPAHAWNATFLAERLFALPIANRPEAWSRHFASDRSSLTGRATEIADWATNVDARVAHGEVVRLVALTLACLNAAANDRLRTRATAGLANLLMGSPSVAEELLSRFGKEPEIRAALALAESRNQGTPS